MLVGLDPLRGAPRRSAWRWGAGGSGARRARAGIEDAERLTEAGDLIVACDDGDDLLSRLS